MRPIRLELEGFASFREPTTLDLADADLFVLSGPTGAGKSSLIDAMTFALYGSVPRYDDRRAVAPVISQGRAEARVRLDFRVGSQGWTAVRVVRRHGTGATTKEARLERWRGNDPADTEVAASSAPDVNARVEQLLGLSYDHFTTCIVLPQGAFQHFLHARGKDRQDLLIELLDLRVYGRIGEAARERARAQQQRAELIQGRLDREAAEATEEALKAARTRVEVLDRLLADVEEREPRLEEIRAEGTAQAAAATEARNRAERLRAVRRPDDVATLVDALAAARAAHRELVARQEAAIAAAAEADRALDAAPETGPIEAQLTRLAEQAEVRSRLVEAEAALVAAQATHATATTTLAERRAQADTTAEALRLAERHDRAAALAAGLHAGDDCPVCARPLESDPDLAPGDALRAATDAHATATAALQAAESEHRAAEAAVGRAEAAVEQHAARRDDLAARVAAAVAAGVGDDAEALRAALEGRRRLEQAVRTCRADERAATEAVREAAARTEAADGALTGAWQDFDAVWQGLADLGPPTYGRDDLGEAWRTLAAWTAERVPALEQEASVAAERVQQTRERYAAEQQALVARCAEDELPVTTDAPVRDQVRVARTRAEHDVERITERLADAEGLRAELAEARRQQQLAHALGQHLKANNFPQWLLKRALQRLVVTATALLRELSDGAYSLALDDGGAFLVVDHRNADEVRSARTLSGGETFLASLALALALSEDVAALAANGAARLESLFLDEGFGTLDAETLDTVAAALEELGSRGRMVGVITHVPALAQRLPVRFDVRKVGSSSSVARADTDGDGGT